MAVIQTRASKSGEKSYRVLIRLKGYLTQTATFNRKTDAKRWAQNTESAIRQCRHFKSVEAKKHTVSDLIDRYLKTVMPQKKPRSQDVQTPQLLWWKERIGHCLLSDVTPSLVAEQRDVLLNGITVRGEKRSPSTVNRYLAALSHAFSIAVKEWGWLDDSPMRKVTKPKEPRGRVRFLSDDERNRLLEACKNIKSTCLYDIVVVALATGMRMGEILTLQWDQVDINRRCITLMQTKNGEIRVVPLVGHALEVVTERKRSRNNDNPYLFPAPSGRIKEPKPIEIRHSWEKAVRLAKIEDFRFHDLRHSTASYLAMNGATSAEIAEVLGHKTLQMVKRYAHLSDVHTSNLMEKMNRKMFEGIGEESGKGGGDSQSEE